MTEAVRLVVWDLDETFWEGTLTEGGIKVTPEANIAMVKELNRRGIMSSICSKNDREPVVSVLKSMDVYDDFIFPSIDWSAKGHRIKEIVSKANLRPESVLFIDDNPGNRAEAAAIVPGLQIEDEHFVAKLLADRRFIGKSDPELSRLKQYKVIESKLSDQNDSGMSNEDFLRQSDIQLKIDYDLDDKLERVVELVNRTNQLNYTKHRLPEDISEACAALRVELNNFNIQAGLISVVDRYGDYGAIGFFMLSSVHEIAADGKSRGELIHYCFSCRTLGMLVEQWVYHFLGKPRLSTVGHVLTDLTLDKKVDWINLVESFDTNAVRAEPEFPKITLFGGCEANAIAVYLQAQTHELQCYGNYRANGCFVRSASAVHAVNMCENDPNVVGQIAKDLHIPLSRIAGDIFEDAPVGSVFIFNCSGDSANAAHFRHKTTGLTLNIEPPLMPGLHFMTSSKSNILSKIDSSRSDMLSYTGHVFDYINQHFELIDHVPEYDRIDFMRQLIDRVPEGCKIIIMADHDSIRISESETQHLPWFTDYATTMRRLSEEFDYCGFLSFSDVIRGEREIQLHGNHYDREVYLRTANRLCELAAGLPGRSRPLAQASAAE